MIPDAMGRCDTLGSCATKAPADYKAPTQRVNRPDLGMIYPKTVEEKISSVKMVPQRNRWAEEEKPMGCRKFAPRVATVKKEGGLKIIRDEKTGEMFKEKRSQVMSFSDLTGTKRTFGDKPGFKDPSKEDPDAFPGTKGRNSDYDASGKMIDYSLKTNGGFFGVKRLPDVTVFKGAAGPTNDGALASVNANKMIVIGGIDSFFG
jgi:hypothetical protein